MGLQQRAQTNHSCKLSTTTCALDVGRVTGTLAFEDIFQSAEGILCMSM